MKLDNSEHEYGLFKGKIVIAYLTNPPEGFIGGIAISNPEIIEFNGRAFLFGYVPNSIVDWTSGLRVGIALEQIAHFLEFDDERELLDKMALANQMKAVQ